MYNFPGRFGPPSAGFQAPGVGLPPGLQDGAHQSEAQSRMPPHMPHINFNAPVIRLGTTGAPRSSERREPGSDRRPLPSDTASAPLPPTKDEVLRTIFIANISGSISDGIERVLTAAGNAKRWTRPTDAAGLPCTFGLAEFDPPNLKSAIAALQTCPATEGLFKVFVDDATTAYLETIGDPDPASHDAQVEAAQQAISAIIADLANPAAHAANQDVSAVAEDEQNKGQDEQNGTAEVVTIPLSADDELADIPAEMRETVAKEIAAFRERSNRRDQERLRREEDAESRPSRPVSTPAGPREKQVPNAPSGPRGFTTAQQARDDEDTDADDDELEKRRQQAKAEEHEQEYLNQERKWMNRERSRTTAIDGERTRGKEDLEKRDSVKQKELARLREYNDDDDIDRSQWISSRATSRAQEANLDDIDRANEERELAREQQHSGRQAMDVDTKDEPSQEPQRFKLSLGAAAHKAQTGQNKRTVTEVGGLFEDDTGQEKAKRTLVPIKFVS